MQHYEFPRISHLSDVLPHIRGVEEIKVMDRDDYKVVDYLYVQPETFPTIPAEPGPARDLAIMRRECRGLLFTHSGELLGRRFHKFFNLGERDETQPNLIDFSRTHQILAKEDGSMVSAYMDPAERVRWVNERRESYYQRVWFGTMMGNTDVAQKAEDFARRSNYDYEGFARHVLAHGWNPIFEYCSPQARIVLNYQQEKMILIAVRHLETGVYKSIEELREYGREWGFPVVEDYGSVTGPVDVFLERVRNQTDIEGYVIRFDDGHKIKMKTQWYLRFHKSKENLVFEKDVWGLILNGQVDDVLPVLMDHDRIRLQEYQRKFNRALNEAAVGLVNWAQFLYHESGGDRRTFAELAKNNLTGSMLSLVFKLFDQPLDAAYDVVRGFAMQNISTASRVEKAREIIKVEPWS